MPEDQREHEYYEYYYGFYDAASQHPATYRATPAPMDRSPSSNDQHHDQHALPACLAERGLYYYYGENCFNNELAETLRSRSSFDTWWEIWPSVLQRYLNISVRDHESAQHSTSTTMPSG
jgi:hypothetical protein